MRQALLAGLVALLALPAAAAAAPPVAQQQLALMVLPQAAFGQRVAKLPIDSDSGVQTNAEAADNDLDPTMTGARMGQLGRRTGYTLAFVSTPALAAGRGLVSAGSSVAVFRDGASAAAFLAREQRMVAGAVGKTSNGAKIESVSIFRVKGLGGGAFGVHARASAGGLRIWLTEVELRRGSIVGAVAFVRRDAIVEAAAAGSLAPRLASRIDGVLAGRLRGKPTPLPSSTKQKLGGLGRPKGGPDLAAMAIRIGDLPGSRLEREGYKRNPDDVAEYERKLAGGTLGGARVVDIESDVELQQSANDGLGFATAIRGVLAGREGAAFLERAFRAGMGGAVRVTSIRVDRPRTLAAGDPSFVVHARVVAGGFTIGVAFVVVRVGPVVQTLIVVQSGLPRDADLTRLARLATARMRSALGSG